MTVIIATCYNHDTKRKVEIENIEFRKFTIVYKLSCGHDISLNFDNDRQTVYMLIRDRETVAQKYCYISKANRKNDDPLEGLSSLFG